MLKQKKKIVFLDSELNPEKWRENDLHQAAVEATVGSIREGKEGMRGL